jgi:hypothetical protein
MKRIPAAILVMLSLCAYAAAQSVASKSTRPRAKRAAADTGSKSAATADDEVERLLDRNVLAQGGVALFLVKTRIMRGAAEMSTSDQPGTFESYEKMPKKSLIVINAPSGQFIQASDGGMRWVKSPWGGAATAGPVADDPSSRRAPGANGFKWRSIFSSARLKGRAVVEGRETVVLAATPVGGEPVLMYFDAETALLRKQEFVRPGGGKDDELKAVYIDSYGTVDGLKVPSVFRHVYANFTITFRVYEVKHNVTIDDALFASPSGK